MPSNVIGSRSAIREHAERSAPEEAAAILQAGKVAHVGFERQGQPYVIPFTYGYRAGRLYVHGGPNSRALLHLATGAEVCVTVTELDGLVYSRTARYHSVNYRSVVCFGRGRRIEDRELKEAVLAEMIERYFPGRTAGRDYLPPPAAHLDSTILIEVVIDEQSAKRRTGGPKGPTDSDPDAFGTAGVIEIGAGRD
jgi:nitroimidazol reductase NimA-like FMN-containing flavoprotein (pyridoxamine 5'-phosphate oxidase superfamily)